MSVCVCVDYMMVPVDRLLTRGTVIHGNGAKAKTVHGGKGTFLYQGHGNVILS